ncbi:OmpR/PhoB-type domain-containing protein [Novosphingobium lubricantis]|jgi:hypothetical protein
MATARFVPKEHPQELAGVVVGWKHRVFARNIHLTVQSTERGLGPASIDRHDLLMTRNQALLLANDLLRLSGQELPIRRRRGWLARLFGWF